MKVMGRPSLTPSARLAMLESFSLSPDERKVLLAGFEQISLALEALDAFVSREAAPATTFSPLKALEEDP